MSTYLVQNKEWLVPVLVAAIAGVFGLLKLVRQTDKPSTLPIAVNQNTTVTIADRPNIASSQIDKSSNLDSSAKSRINEATIKASKKILFIDDDRTFKMVSLLKRGGWQNVAVIADVRRLDQEELVAADIIFCDVQGVGQKLSFAGEGLGLAKAIKQKYPDKKIVIYSAITGHDPFSDGFRLADDMLSKNAEFYEFEKTALDLLS